ncbi:fimbrial protein [Erwinia pyrifoliae]|uniref:Fimbrial protein n=2 Tax=Erwinia pyrifoliae TaxID=79967 RepID=A0ABY5XA63_ERWPY|nr:fimbrial protein [Erwinia pyrifoliae]AUX74127.1 fimbrial protein [Erwinia pyrifoliae]MCA8875526.1 fimbrial protein [Erwinia pyrifoliae]UWS33893.1 fimbrial protein [Erwinia pyrifoliae]
MIVMKRTLISLALAATVASGSAMAWTANGSGGNFELGGSLNPFTPETPWEVKVGDAITGLDAEVQKGQKMVEIKLNNAIPILGIRTKVKKAFAGKSGYSPQIDFGDAIDMGDLISGDLKLTLAVKGLDGAKIGTMTAPFFAAGFMSWKNTNSGNGGSAGMYASSPGDGFFGGLRTIDDQSNPADNVRAAIKLMPDIADKLDPQGFTLEKEMDKVSFNVSKLLYSGFYASGIEAGKAVRIALESPASADVPVQWKASLPVTVVYM